MGNSENVELDGIIRTCPICNKQFYIGVPELWQYKLEDVTKDGKREMVYLNKYSCKRKYEADAEERMLKRRSNASKKGHQTRRKQAGLTPERPSSGEKWEGKHCGDCANCLEDDFGFYECIAKHLAVNPHKVACRKYIGKEQNENV